MISINGFAQSQSSAQSVRLSDGRNICYEEFGDQKGAPYFYFHGFPGSRMDVLFFNGDNTAKEKGIRLIAVDRPGYGGSDFKEKRKLTDWPGDIAELADLLGIDKFSVIGYSGGGPYALVCAYKIPERLNDVIVISGMVPPGAPKAKKGSSMFIPKLPRFMHNMILKGMNKLLIENPDKYFSNMKKVTPEVDIKAIEDEQAKTAFKNTLIEAMKVDHRGAKQDARIYKKDWGFRLSDVTRQVYFIYGEKDLNISNEAVKHVVKELPACTPVFYPEEGHISLITRYFDRIPGLPVKQ